MTNLRPGDRCIIIKSAVGDEGRIVTVIGYFDGKYFEGGWFMECDVMIKPLDGTLASINESTALIRNHNTRPFISKYLRKLPDVLDDLDEIEKRLVPLFYPETIE